MEKRQLGNTDLQITRIGFGAWAIGGGDWAYGWGPGDDEAAIGAIRHALEIGMNWIDTAAVYGLGHSEELIARALKGLSNKPYIFTKCGLVWDDSRRTRQNLKANSIRKECEASLRRLKVDAIDLYQIHWPVDEDIEEAWEMMAQLKDEGKVHYIGLSNFNTGQIRRCQSIAPVSSLQPPYSLISRDYEAETLPYCLDQAIGTIVYSPMGSGLLTGTMTRERIASLPEDDWRRKSPEFNEPALSKHLDLVENLIKIGKTRLCSAGEIAIAWTLQNPAVTAAIVGGRTAWQVDGIRKAWEIRLTDEEMRRLV